MKIGKQLKIALRGNGVFSSLSGVLLLLDPNQIAGWLGTPGIELALGFVGANLVSFAAVLFFVSAREMVPASLIRAIIALDLAWVAGTALLLALNVLSPAGVALVSVIALIVLGFAGWQYAGLRQSTAWKAST